MSRTRLFVISGLLAAGAVVCLITGIILLQKNIASYVAGHYHEYAHDVNGRRYQCSGSPRQAADTLPRTRTPRRAPTTATPNTCGTPTTS